MGVSSPENLVKLTSWGQHHRGTEIQREPWRPERRTRWRWTSGRRRHNTASCAWTPETYLANIKPVKFSLTWFKFKFAGKWLHNKVQTKFPSVSSSFTLGYKMTTRNLVYQTNLRQRGHSCNGWVGVNLRGAEKNGFKDDSDGLHPLRLNNALNFILDLRRIINLDTHNTLIKARLIHFLWARAILYFLT